MTDQEAQFLILVGEACASAHLAGLAVEVRTTDGGRVAGIPETRRARPDDELDGTGWGRRLSVGGRPLDLASVTELRICGPERG